MSTQTSISPEVSPGIAPDIPNGSEGAAILSAGLGSFALAVLTIVADQSETAKAVLSIWKPAGALSGVTTFAVLAWLAAWAILEWRWRKRNLSLKRINAIAFVLLALSLLATFPPLGDLL